MSCLVLRVHRNNKLVSVAHTTKGADEIKMIVLIMEDSNFP